MYYSPIEYDMPLFRPPSEARSLILQITLGCSWNKCAFCEMYPNKSFKARNEAEVLKEIDTIATVSPQVNRVFLADGNAMVLSTGRLLKLLKAINRKFPDLNRISAYALPKDISSKSMEELKSLRENGLKLIYVGIESGDEEVLKMVNKGETFDSTVAGLRKAKEAGVKSSVMILTGLGGKKYWEQHAIHSAQIANQVQPEYLSTLVLMFPLGIDRYLERFSGKYVPMELQDVLKEMELFISKTELERTVFRSDHASNYLALKGILSRDKEAFLQHLRSAIKDPEISGLRPDWLRGL